MPEKITKRILDPDSLVVTFMDPLMFMDTTDLTQLDSMVEISHNMQP